MNRALGNGTRGFDEGTQRLNERLAELGLPLGTVQTMFEFIDLDEGRFQLPGAAA